METEIVLPRSEVRLIHSYYIENNPVQTFFPYSIKLCSEVHPFTFNDPLFYLPF